MKIRTIFLTGVLNEILQKYIQLCAASDSQQSGIAFSDYIHGINFSKFC